MKKSLLNLYEFTTQSLKPQTFNGQKLNPIDFIKWRDFLKNEGDELRTQLNDYFLTQVNENEKISWLNILQEQLIFLSDEINRNLYREKRIWESHISAVMIKSHYQYTLNFFEELLHYIASRFSPYHNKSLKISDYRIKNIQPELRSQIYKLKLILDNAGVQSELSNIVFKGLIGLLNNNLTENSSRYIRHFYQQTEKIDKLCDDRFIHLLIKLNFNQPEFYLYKIDILDQRLIAIHGLNEQHELLYQQSENIAKIETNTEYALHPKQAVLKDHLTSYFSERRVAIEELMEIRRAAVKDKINSQQAFRILTNLTVPQLTLFFRVQLEVGLILKEHITEVYNFVAQHFYTEKAVFISSSNMLKLSTNVEFAAVLKVYDMLNLMINWLDDQFGVKNFKR